jgi:hypothetical protein
MDISYASRSKFLEPCIAAIREHRADLEAGETVRVLLGESGYEGRVVVHIRQTERSWFGTDWTSSDPTRFPARIKAAATALLDCGCKGEFEITHDGGTLGIRAL